MGAQVQARVILACYLLPVARSARLAVISRGTRYPLGMSVYWAS